MPLFAISCIDKPDSLGLRMATREAHFAYVNGGHTAAQLRLGGPYLDENGNMAGSLMIVEARDRAEAEEFSKNDPYVRAGLFRSVEIRPYRITFGPHFDRQ
jgi:uncharacterized protein YciI